MAKKALYVDSNGILQQDNGEFIENRGYTDETSGKVLNGASVDFNDLDDTGFFTVNATTELNTPVGTFSAGNWSLIVNKLDPLAGTPSVQQIATLRASNSTYSRVRAGASWSGWKLLTAQRTSTITIAASDSRPLSKISADYVCDGTDDQLTINSVIDTLISSGGEIILLEGIYYLTNPILMKSRINFKGQGNGTILFRNSASHQSTIYVANGITDFTISDLIIDGNGSSYKPTESYELWCQNATSNTNSKYSNIHVINAIATNVSYGFFNCVNIDNCSSTNSGINTTFATTATGFRNCRYVNNCRATISTSNTSSGNTSSYGFYSCTQLNNCSSTTTAVSPSNANSNSTGYELCNYLTNCNATANASGTAAGPTYKNQSYGFKGCTYLNNCSASANTTGSASSALSDAFGMYGCTYISNCQSVSISSGGAGSGTAYAYGYAVCSRITNCLADVASNAGSVRYGYGFFQCGGMTCNTALATATTLAVGYKDCYVDFDKAIYPIGTAGTNANNDTPALGWNKGTGRNP